ncbi:OmpA family protein [Actinomadura craniellae]|uniref:OmpA family protein n=1 Tax=Actinomadura craniellae TaxID=2231787 RepID=UPI0011BD8C0F|nr:OmpA family protein [Actinomadura craniellae]
MRRPALAPLVLAAGLVTVLVTGPATGAPAHAEPTPTPSPTWPVPGAARTPGAAVSGSPLPITGKPEGYTLQELRKPYVAVEDTQESGGRSGYSLSSDVLFKSGSAELTGGAQASLQDVADKLRKSGVSGQAQVVGHTDDVGADADNLRLSRERAEAVRSALQPLLANTGITLVAEGKGETEPRVKEATETARAQNRRVVIAYRPPAAQPPPPGSEYVIAQPLAAPAPAAAAQAADLPVRPLFSTQRDIENQGGRWTVRIDVTEFAREGRTLRVGYYTRLVNSAQSTELRYSAIFNGSTSYGQTRYRGVLLDKKAGQQLEVITSGAGWQAKDGYGAGETLNGWPRYGFAYFPLPGDTGQKSLSLYIPAMGTIDLTLR